MKQLFVLALGVFAVSAHAQFAYHGYSETFENFQTTQVGNYPSGVVEHFGAPDAYMDMETIDSWNLDSQGSYWFGQHNYFFNLSTGSLQPRINSYDMTLNGKFVFEGGTSNSNVTADFYADICFYQFDDDNHNDLYDVGEASYTALLSGNVQIASLSASGSQDYDTTISAAASTPIVFDANSHYFALAQIYFIASGTYDPNDPQITITNEFNKPDWDGATLHFNHEPVPEPATLTLLAIPALAAVKRRRNMR